MDKIGKKPPRSRIVKGELLESRNMKIEWARLTTGSPRGLVFAPPLIGGSLVQQIHLLRWMGRIGFDVFSFNYFGHGNSSGKFSLRKSLHNTVSAASQVSRNHGRPSAFLVGFAGCYSAIPLLFAAQKLGEPFRQIVLINPLIDLKPAAVLRSFFGYYRSFLAHPGAKKNIGLASKRYVDFLFPNIKKDKQSFGVLERRRTRLIEVLVDFFFFSPLKSVTVANTPVLCLYARKDRVLDALEAKKSLYEEGIRQICPHASFNPLETDHFFGAAKSREYARRAIAMFLSRPHFSGLQMAV